MTSAAIISINVSAGALARRGLSGRTSAAKPPRTIVLCLLAATGYWSFLAPPSSQLLIAASYPSPPSTPARP